MIVELSTPPAPSAMNSPPSPAAAAHELEGDELRRDELSERLRWLINLRWVALLGVFLAIILARRLALVPSIFPLVAIGMTMGLLNAAFHIVHQHFHERPLRALSREALLQIGVDVIGLALLLFHAGGLSNPFIFYFSFHVVIAAILLEKRQAYIVALLAAVVIVLLGLADEFNIVPPAPLRGALAGPLPSMLSRFELVFALSTTLIISVYMVTAIMDSLRARTQDVRRLNRDLADRVERLAAAEKKLAAEHQRARAILECMDEGVVVVDLFGRVMLANTAAQTSALAALEETGARQETASHKPKKAYCGGPLSGENLLQRQHGMGEAAAGCKRGEGAAPVDVEAAAQAQCPVGKPAACLQEALANGGWLCPATLALMGAGEPNREYPERLMPPRARTLAQIEIQGRYFENTVSAVRSVAGEALGLVIVSRDVTERRLLERQVVHAEKLNALGNLAAGVAHELNTPLGTILGYAQMLLDDERASLQNELGTSGKTGCEADAPRRASGTRKPNETISKEDMARKAGEDPRRPLQADAKQAVLSGALKAVEDQARRCRKIVQSLLDLAHKSNAGREHSSANDLALKVRELLAHAMRLRGVELRLDLADPPPPPLLLCASEFEQVLVNLITNAADALESTVPALAGTTACEKGPASGASTAGSAARLRAVLAPRGACISIQTRVRHADVLIAVEDNGPGVSGDIAGQVFEPFFTTKAAGRGTGLGLSIARRIVEDHGGTLELAPRPDDLPGARFEIRIPFPFPIFTGAMRGDEPGPTISQGRR